MPSLHLFDDGFCGSRALFNHAIDFLSCHGLKFVINRYSFTMNQSTNGYELPGAHQDGLLELLTPKKPLSIMERLNITISVEFFGFKSIQIVIEIKSVIGQGRESMEWLPLTR